MNVSQKRITPRLAFAFAAVSIMAAAPLPVLAAPAAHEQNVQVPGYYRYAVGDVTVTAIYDGYVNIASSLLKGIEAADAEALFRRMFLTTGKDGVQTAVNAFLVDTSNGLVLIDSGAASCFGPTTGNMLKNIRAAGYAPEDVKTVLLTHMHPDHICGLASEGKAVFPNATVMASRAESDYWLNPETAAAAPEAQHAAFKMAQDAIAPYQTKHAFKTFNNGDTVAPGIDAVPTPGHTPGHTSLLLHSGQDNMLIWGDIVHSHAIQFARPEVAIAFDSDTTKAVESRKMVLEEAAKNHWLIGGAHLPFPGIGHVRKDAQGYAWVPVEYAPL